MRNAGFDGALILDKLLEQDDHNLGYDAAKGLFFRSLKTQNFYGIEDFHFFP